LSNNRDVENGDMENGNVEKRARGLPHGNKQRRQEEKFFFFQVETNKWASIEALGFFWVYASLEAYVADVSAGLRDNFHGDSLGLGFKPGQGT